MLRLGQEVVIYDMGSGDITSAYIVAINQSSMVIVRTIRGELKVLEKDRVYPRFSKNKEDWA